MVKLLMQYRVISNRERLNHALLKALNGDELSNNDIIYLLQLRKKHDLQILFETAREIRKKYFKSIFLYGFVYFSTYCRNDCIFCFYRRSNLGCVRYRKKDEDVAALSGALEDLGVHVVDLTMGEDPAIHEGSWDKLLSLISTVNESIEIPIMISPGVLPKSLFRKVKAVGADWYACYQETHNKDLFSKLRPMQDYNLRLRAKKWALSEGLLIEEGILIGIGESIEDRLNSIKIMKKIGAHQVRAMSFVPHKGTPMEDRPPPQQIDELVTIAVMRLVHQDKLIPASLDIEGIKGLEARLNAGANVITSIIQPKSGLAGVAQPDIDIEEGKRSIDAIYQVLDSIGLKVARQSAYEDFMASF